MSGTRHSTFHRAVSVFPACPLEPHLASPNRVLGGEVCRTLPRNAPDGAACATILLCESEAIGCSVQLPPLPFGRGPFRVALQDQVEMQKIA